MDVKTLLNEMTDEQLAETFEAAYQMLSVVGMFEQDFGLKPKGWMIGCELFFEQVEKAMLVRPGCNAARVTCEFCGNQRQPDGVCVNLECIPFSSWDKAEVQS